MCERKAFTENPFIFNEIASSLAKRCRTRAKAENLRIGTVWAREVGRQAHGDSKRRCHVKLCATVELTRDGWDVSRPEDLLRLDVVVYQHRFD